MWERTICGIRAGELDISLVRGIGNTRSLLVSILTVIDDDSTL